MGCPPDGGLAAVLSYHRGTVTDLVQELAGEAVDADVRAQWSSQARPGNALELDAGTEVLQRTVLLRGRRSGQAFVYAETSIAPTRLPVAVRERLEQSCDPIGRVLSAYRLSVRREPLPGPVDAAYAEASLSGQLAAAPLSRRYRILVGTTPAFAVSEWFLTPAAEAAAGQST